jgi:hypothetical protein
MADYKVTLYTPALGGPGPGYQQYTFTKTFANFSLLEKWTQSFMSNGILHEQPVGSGSYVWHHPQRIGAVTIKVI